MENKRWLVYAHISPSKKIYIGITSQKPNDRWRKGEGYKKSVKFYNAIKKYGWDNFEHIILFENLCREMANEIEKSLILKYDSINKGYNITKGGYTSNPLTTREERRKGSNRNRMVYRYTLNGEYIDNFFSISEAERLTGINKTTISHCLNDRSHNAGGYLWTDIYYKKISPYTNLKEKTVCMYKINKELIMKFNSIKNASEYSGYSVQDIIDCCKRRIQTLDEYVFLYNDIDIRNIEILNVHYKHSAKAKHIYQYLFNGKLMNSFDNASEASRQTGDTIQMILSQCKNEIKMSTKPYYYTFDINGWSKIMPYVNKYRKKIIQIDLNGNIIKEFYSITEASNYTGININCIIGVLKHRNKTAGGYIWKYAAVLEEKAS